MKVIVGLLGSGLAVLSAGILLYVSMATGLGPWLAPTLVLLSVLFLSVFSRRTTQHDVLVAQAIGSTGGSVAVAVGFSLPTFYFLQPAAFAALLADPLSFAVMLGGVTLAAGLWGIWIAHQQSFELLADTQLRFPVSAAISNTITSTTRTAQTWLLSSGVAFASFICFLRDGWRNIQPIIARTFYVGQSYVGATVPIEILPVAWAIGFLAGLPIVLPLVVGMLSKYLIVTPLSMHASFLPFRLFGPLSYLDFTFAFCSGIVLSQTVQSIITMPRLFAGKVKQLWQDQSLILPDGALAKAGEGGSLYNLWCRYEMFIALTVCISVLWSLSFPLLAQLLLLGLSVLFIQHLNAFACRTGLGTYGRYMTFTMVPIMLATTVSELQITLLCLFVGVAGAAAVDMLFSYKVAHDIGMPVDRIHRAQLLGLVVTTVVIGALFWLLCSHFQLGGLELVAHRGRGRALLLHSFHFNWIVLALGACYGALLKWLRVNPILAFGGLIMPNAITIGLAFGAVAQKLTPKPDRYTPFWSGVFAGDALWILFRLLF